MIDISTETQKWIIRLVKKQKKVELDFISRATEVPVEEIIKNAEKMGLYTDGECLFCPSHPDAQLLLSKKEEIPFRKITDDFVFCPKCGKKNTFSFGEPNEETNYYCAYCQCWLNFYWTEYIHGKTSLDTCEACQQQTFTQGKFCISCGSYQSHYKPVARPIHEKPSSFTNKKGLILFFAIPQVVYCIPLAISFILCAAMPGGIGSIYATAFMFIFFGFPALCCLQVIAFGIYAIVKLVRQKKLRQEEM